MAAVEYLRKLAQGYATAGAPIPKGELGQLLAKKGYDAAERAAAFDAAVADDGGFLTMSSTGTNVWFKVKPAQAPDAVACLRQLVDGYASQGRPIPHKGDLGQLLRDSGYDADQRAAAFKAAVAAEGGFLTPEGTGANLMFKLRATAKRTVAPAAATTAKTVSEAVTLLKRFVDACGGTATPKTDFGQRLAEHGIGKKERVAAFTEAEGPNGFVDVRGQGATVMYVPRKAKASTVTSPPHLATSTNNEGAVAALRRFIEERGSGQATLKAQLGHMLAQKGYDAQQRAAAFAEAESSAKGFVDVVGANEMTSYSLRRTLSSQNAAVRSQPTVQLQAPTGAQVSSVCAVAAPPKFQCPNIGAKEIEVEVRLAIDELDAIGAPVTSMAIAQLLAQLGYGLGECSRVVVRSLAHRAAATGDVSALSKWLAGAVYLDVTDTNGWTAVHHAAKGGRLECLQLLHKAGASLDVKTTSGLTAAHCAGQGGHVACFQWLETVRVQKWLPAAARGGEELSLKDVTSAGVDRRGTRATDDAVKAQSNRMRQTTDAMGGQSKPTLPTGVEPTVSLTTTAAKSQPLTTATADGNGRRHVGLMVSVVAFVAMSVRRLLLI